MARAAVPRPEYPRPQFRRPEWQCLNGRWEFERDPGDSGRARGLPTADELARSIVVPFPTESDLSGIGDRDFIPTVWYRREIEIPVAWLDGRVHLHFGAVDYETEVWVNGEAVARHRGGYSPFSVDLTTVVAPGTNTIIVCARDDVRSGTQPAGKQSRRYESHGPFYTRVTGIWQPVWLEPLPDPFIAELSLRPDLENGGVLGEVMIDGNASGHAVHTVASFEEAVVGTDTSVATGGRCPFVIELEDVHPWSPEQPALYDLTVSIRQEGTVIDSVGIVSLNGEPRFQRLVLDQGYYPDGVYTAPTDDALRRDIERAKSMGFNGARLHEKVFEPRYLHHADRLGFLVWGEYGDWQLDRTDPGNVHRVLQEWLDVLARDANHPCIAGRTPFNETPQVDRWTCNDPSTA